MKTPKEAKSIKDVKIKPIDVKKIQGEEFPPENVEADSMRKIEKPDYIAAKEAMIRENRMRKFFNANYDTMLDCLESLAILNEYKPFDSNQGRASYVFTGAILMAMRVFGFRLGYGDPEYRKEDKLAIIKHLQEIHEILKK